VTALLATENVRVEFADRRRLARAPLVALDGVSLEVEDGQAIGVVGESGSGKTTLARTLLGLQAPTLGRVLFRGQPLIRGARTVMSQMRSEVQAVFQDPFGSLDPRMPAGDAITEALEARGRASDPDAVRGALESALADVGLDASLAERYPHQLSGGQCQRVSIARAIIGDPRLLVCDEAVSALDVSVQAQVVNLLRGLRSRREMALLFVSHNIAVVRLLCDWIVVLHRGRIVEQGATDELFTAPRDPYTQALIAAVPRAPWLERPVFANEEAGHGWSA
jgi:peptide/nickel transport system ATP-binding protein